MARPLSIRFYEGDTIPESVLRDIWSVRLEMLTLTRTRDQDWAMFSTWVRGPDKCLFVFVDEADRAQGFFTIAFLPVDVAERRLLLMYSKFFYFRRAYRGHPRTMLAPWRLLPLSLRRYGLRSLHFVTTAFPQSYVSLYRSSGRVWSLREPEAPAWKRQALLSFARTFCAEHFDEDKGLVGGSNVADSASMPRSAEASALHDKYERLNPDWRQGFSLPILFSVDSRLVYHNLRRFLRRARRT